VGLGNGKDGAVNFRRGHACLSEQFYYATVTFCPGYATVA
jgi:hypothetical protein